MLGSSSTTESDLIKSRNPLPHGTTYKKECILGSGAFGTVYKGHDITKPEVVVALKKIFINSKGGFETSIIREIGIAKQVGRFGHPNIVKLIDVCGGQYKTENYLSLFLVLEYVEEDLYRYLRRHLMTPLSQQRIKDIGFDILSGLDFLHKNLITHRDLKPQNLLVSAKGQVKIADFGLAKIYDCCRRLTTPVVTQWYRAPEILLGVKYGFPVDLWAFGAILAELFIVRWAIFPGTSEKNQLDVIFDVIGTPEEREWPADSPILRSTFTARPPRLLEVVIPGLCNDPLAKDLIQQLIYFNPQKRPTTWGALAHPYFAGLIPPQLPLIMD